MATTESVGASILRTQDFDGVVKGIAARSYKFKQAVTVIPTSAWKNYFFREDPDVLAGGTTSNIRGIPRGAAFPQASVEFERILSTIEKYGLRDFIYEEDMLSDDIDVMMRTLIKIAEGVVKSVDDAIWDALTENRAPTNINSISVTAGWSLSSAAIMDDLESAEQQIAENNYPVDNFLVYINPRDKRFIMKFLTDKGAQFPNLTEQKLNAGSIGKLGNKTFIVSRSVTSSYALMVVPKRCATWKELRPLKTETEESKGRGISVLSWEYGTLQLTDPKCVTLIGGTANTDT